MRRGSPAGEASGEVGARAVGLQAVESLVGCGGAQAAQCRDVGPELHVVEGAGREVRRQLGAARVPCGAEAAAERACRCGQARHLGRVAVAAHQAEAGDRIAVAFEQFREDGGRERLADLLLQLGAVASRAAVGAARDVYGERHLVRNLLEYDVVVGVLQHRSAFYAVRALRSSRDSAEASAAGL